MPNSEDLKRLVADVQKTEHLYLLHGPRHDPVTTPWMPYQPADFIGILWECLPELEGNKFADVGCGPGTKMQIARDLFGLEVYGVEIDKHMATEAGCRMPGRVIRADALEHPVAWETFDLIWLYRPFRDQSSEFRLEEKIMSQMKPGAVLAGSSWEHDPGRMGWQPIVDDCLPAPDNSISIVRGAWQKTE